MVLCLDIGFNNEVMRTKDYWIRKGLSYHFTDEEKQFRLLKKNKKLYNSINLAMGQYREFWIKEIDRKV